MSTVWITGYEHGTALIINGGGLSDSIYGSPTVQAGDKRSGVYALLIETSSAVEGYLKNIGTGSETLIVGRLYFTPRTLASAYHSIFSIRTSAGTQFEFRINNSNQLYAAVGGSGSVTYGAVSVDTEYRIDFRVDCSTTTGTIDWEVNGSAQSQSSASISASDFNRCYVGWPFNTVTAKFMFDDIILTDATGDYPIGEGEVIGLSPTGDGSHNNGSGRIQDNDSNAIDGVTAFDHIDKVPLSESSVYIKQDSNGEDDYIEVTFPDISASAVNGAMGVLAYDGPGGGGANEGACYVRNSDPANTEIWGLPQPNQKDYSESAFFYKSAPIAEPSGGWDQAEINALVMRMGHSGDANPDPNWRNVMIEVDYVAGAGDQTISLAGAIASAEAFGSHKLNFRLFPSAIAGGEAFGTAKLNHAIAPSGIATAEVFGSPQLNFRLFPSGIGSLEAFGTTVVVLSDQYILPDAIASLEAIGSHQLNFRLFPSGIASLEAFGSAQLNLRLLMSGIASGEAFGAHTIVVMGGAQTIIPDAIGSLEAFGATIVILSDQYILPGGIASGEAFGSAQLNFRIFPSSVISAEVFGAPVLGITIDPTGIGSGEVFGTPQLNFRLFPAGIITGEAFGATVVVLSDQYILPNGIASLEAFGTTVIILSGEGAIPILFDLQKDGIFGLNKTTVFNLTKDNVFLFGQGNRKK